MQLLGAWWFRFILRLFFFEAVTTCLLLWDQVVRCLHACADEVVRILLAEFQLPIDVSQIPCRPWRSAVVSGGAVS
eukprot:s23_g40.t1